MNNSLSDVSATVSEDETIWGRRNGGSYRWWRREVVTEARSGTGGTKRWWGRHRLTDYYGWWHGLS
jgi:hypothetical protein